MHKRPHESGAFFNDEKAEALPEEYSRKFVKDA